MTNSKIYKVFIIVFAGIYALIGLPLIPLHHMIPPYLTILLFIISEIFFIAAAAMAIIRLIKLKASTKKRKVIQIIFYSYLFAYCSFISIDPYVNFGFSTIVNDIISIASGSILIFLLIIMMIDLVNGDVTSNKKI